MKRCLVFIAGFALNVLSLAPTFAQSQYLSAKGTMVAEKPRSPISWYNPNAAGLNSILSLKVFQDFEAATFPPTNWTLEYTGTLYWTRSTASGYLTGGGSAKFDYYNASTNTTQSLVTPTFTPTVSGDSLKFDYAQAYYNASSIDSLIIETSADSGVTYTSLVRLYSNPTPYVSLSTTSTTASFTPSLLSDWDTKHYNLPVGTNKIRFKAISGFGNNLYLDNIAVGVPPANDISSFAFVSPSSGGTVLPLTPFSPKGAFKNVGSATQASVSVVYQILNPSVVYTNTQSIPSIAAGVVDTVTFGPVSGGLATGSYTLRLIVATSDANSANDTLNGTLSVLPAGTYLSEGFTGTTFPPAGWAAKSSGASSGWSRLAATQSDGASGFAAKLNFYSITAGILDSLKTPTLDLSALAPLARAKGLAYDYAFAPYTTPSPDSVRILVSSDGGATWPSMIYNDGAPNMGTAPPQSGAFTPSSRSQWKHKLIRIPDSLLTNSTRVMFLGKSAFGNNYWLDNVQIAVIADTDYAVVTVAQVNGIPNPFNPAPSGLPNDKSLALQTLIPGFTGVPSSDVNNSIMLDQAQSASYSRVRTYLNGNIFSEGNSPYSISAARPVTVNGVVTNFGLSSPMYSFAWTFDGVAQTPVARGGIASLGSDTVALNITPTRRGTLTAIGEASVANDQNPSNNIQTTYRVLSYPDTPVVRIRYDNGTNIPSTFIGYGATNRPATAGVRFRATSNMRLANIDAYYRNEGTPDSVVVQVWAAGADTTAPGIILYSQTFGGLNYNAAGGDYFTLPLGNNAPAFAAGSDYWVSVRFVPTVQFPMGAQSSGITAGHSFVSSDSGRTWSPLVISSTAYAWLLRTVGTPASPSGPVASLIARSARVPNAGDTVAVTATIVDSLGVTSAWLLYAVNGVNWPPVAMTRVSGTPQNGSYWGVIPATADSNGARVEYQIKAMSASGVTTTTAVTGANSYFAGISPLSLTGVRAMSASRQLLYANYYCRVTGTVNGPNFTVLSGRINYTFQDAVGGIAVSRGATTLTLNVGDSIVVFGALGQFRGTTQLTPDSVNHITVVATGRTVPVTQVTVNAYNANPEAYEGRLIKETSLQRLRATPAWGNNVSIPVYQNVVGDSTLVFLDADTPVPSGTEPTYPVTVTGIGGQYSSSSLLYNDGYEIIPRSAADFTSPPTALSGSYTVGTGGNFPTLDSAFTVLKAQGVSAAVTLSLIDTAYSAPERPIGQNEISALRRRGAEVDPLDPQLVNNKGGKELQDGSMNLMSGALTLSGPIPGASAANRITIKPATNTAVTITSTGIWGINLLNASFVTIDGVALTGPTRLTINAPSATTGAVLMEGNSDNNILQNTTIRTSLTSAEGVYLAADSATATPDSNKIQSNAVLRALDGIVIVGNATSFPNANWIANNQIGSATDSIGEAGIYVQQAFNTVIDRNYIQNIRQAATTYNVAGIWIATKHFNTQISNNVIRNVKVGTTTTAAVFASGMYIFGTAADTTSGNYFNNMIYDVNNLGTVSGGTVRGIYASSGMRDTIVYNSIYLTGTAATNITSGGLYTSTHVGQVLRNNIVVNARTEMGTGRAMAYYKLSTTSTIISNYNDLYVPTQALSYVGAVGTTNYATLANWQATTQDSQSVNVWANFRSPDLHIDSTIATPIDGGARPIAGITTDFDGQTRNASTPDIGADEFTVSGPTPGWTVQTSGVTTTLYSVKAVSPTVAWAAAAGGKVLRTVNGGTTWTNVGGGSIGTADIYAIDAISSTTAFATTTPSTTSYIFRTTNGGSSWDTVYAQSGGFIDAIKVYDATNGLAVGDPQGGKWTVARTTNGGASWARIATEPTQVGGEAGSNNGMATVGTNNIWFHANGTASTVYRSTDGGLTWTSSPLPFTATFTAGIAFNNAQYGVAGANGGQAARTTDGGVTWTSVTVASTGAIYGMSGTGVDFYSTRGATVAASTNRGATWTTSYPGGVGALNHISMVASGPSVYGWAVSATGGIAMYFGTVTGVGEPTQQALPTTYALDQNYPNPFNPSTTIKYALPEAAHVTLSIYNLLGQRVAELTNEVQSAGFYSTIWNGRNQSQSQIASGVYFYRIEATPANGGSPFTSLKKMLLLK